MNKFQSIKRFLTQSFLKKKVLFFSFIIFGILLLSLRFVLFKNRSFGKIKRDVIFYKLNGREYKLLIADEPEEWSKGLMFVEKPVDFDGMIFVFPDKKIRQFWNKNTFVDLDVYWIAGDRVVRKDFLPSIKKAKKIVIISSPEPVDKVVEIIK